jgi:hypothetical protein
MPTKGEPDLPGSIGGPPVDVVLSVAIKSITALDVVNQTLEGEIEISAKVLGGARPGAIDPEFDGPYLTVLNGVGIEVMSDTTAGGPPEVRGVDEV